ncbi:hypothetical protein [Streptomyces sp. NPDC007904]|uniref:hypothetical protein n=1 Tax=Streptomyces sp. NPDC007904 TaxID=3364787 RepID=UPI0036E20BF2
MPHDELAWACGATIGAGPPAVLTAVLTAARTAAQRETPGPLPGRVTATADTVVFTPDVLGPAAGAAPVEPRGHRLPPVAAGLAPLVPAAASPQSAARAERTASRSPSDASPAW